MLTRRRRLWTWRFRLPFLQGRTPRMSASIWIWPSCSSPESSKTCPFFPKRTEIAYLITLSPWKVDVLLYEACSHRTFASLQAPQQSRRTWCPLWTYNSRWCILCVNYCLQARLVGKWLRLLKEHDEAVVRNLHLFHHSLMEVRIEVGLLEVWVLHSFLVDASNLYKTKLTP